MATQPTKKQPADDAGDELARLNSALSKFCGAMRARFTRKALEGKRGWDNRECRVDMEIDLHQDSWMVYENDQHVTPNTYVDIANRAMFLYLLHTDAVEQGRDPFEPRDPDDDEDAPPITGLIDPATKKADDQAMRDYAAALPAIDAGSGEVESQSQPAGPPTATNPTNMPDRPADGPLNVAKGVGDIGSQFGKH